MSRLAQRFAALRAENRAGLVTFLTAGDPNADTAWEMLQGLPAAGADVIELGMPFSDPMADGPAIQLASQRALKNGETLAKTLATVKRFRQTEAHTPIVLMGYYNPIYRYGTARFLADAQAAGVDGLIIVDLPPEEENELAVPAKAHGIDFIFLAAPTSDDHRLDAVLRNAGGFVYYVSITGVTGTRAPDLAEVEVALARIRAKTDLPLAVGFGITNPVQAAGFAKIADAAVVGSALVNRIAAKLDDDGIAAPDTAAYVLSLVADLAAGIRTARQ